MKGAIAVEQETSTLLLLEKLESIFDTLLETAEEKQCLVVAGDSSGLEELILREEQVLKDLESLENQVREEAFSQPGIGGCTSLARLKQVVAQKAMRLERLNEQNQKLMSKGLEIVRYELGLLLPQDDYSKTLKTPPIAFDEKV